MILGISVLLLLVQNGFATTEKELNGFIKTYAQYPTLVQLLKCEKEAGFHSSSGNVHKCLKAIEDISNNGDLGPLNNDRHEFLGESYMNAGVLYDHQGDKLNAYKYYMKSAKLGEVDAQKNLNIMCRKSPWACKNGYSIITTYV